MNPASAAAAQINGSSAGWRAVRCLSEWVVGAYALYAVTALRDERLAMAGWIGGLALIIALAIGSVWLRTTTARGRFTLELLLLAAGVLAAPLVPGWTAAWTERAYFVLIARGLVWLVRWAERAGAGPSGVGRAEQLRLLLLFALAGVSLHAYLSPHLVGPKDARWYGNAITDFLSQVRSGVFPVFSGETVYDFNGTVQLFRSAPWHLYFAALVDWLTVRSLAPLAVQHITIVASYLGAVLLFYLALVRLRPAARWTALLLTVIYATSPAIMHPLVVHDMYMTFMAIPVLVFVYHAVARACETPSLRAYVWVGLGCAAMWLCHPPLALLSMVVAGFCLGAQFAINGPALRPLAGAVVAGAVFAALATPYFYTMSEIPPTHNYEPLPHLLLPALALFLLLLALAQAFRRGSIRWLALLPTVGLTLWYFKPSLLPFVSLFVALFAMAVAADHFWSRLALRTHLEPWLLIFFFAAAAAAAKWFPEISLPARGPVSGFVGPAFTSVAEHFGAIIQGSDCQPHAIWWFLLLAGAILMWWTRSRFARLAFAASLVAVAAVYPVPLVKLFIWSNTTVELWDALNVADRMRFWPLAMPLLLFAVFLMLVELTERRPKMHRVVVGIVVLLLPWALWTHGRIVNDIFTRTADQTARLFRSENVVLQNYGWDLLHIPNFCSNGVMDCRLETRLWRQGGDHALLIDPDIIARHMEKCGAETLDLQAAQDPIYPQWLYLSPKVELKPGEHKLLRFDFLGRMINGWIIFRGQDIYRDYTLPSSGFERAFGCGPLNTRTISLWNSGPQTETIELVVKREGPDATAAVPLGEYVRVTVSHYDASRAPIEVKSLSPLLLRVDAPEAGMLELFRNNYPGYRVSVNGRPVPHITSRERLIALAVPSGTSEVLVRFRGTPMLRGMFWYGLAIWTLAALYLGAEMAVVGGVLRWRNKALPA
jgi:hypothetical protein